MEEMLAQGLLAGRKIVLGVTGGIAAYKAVELTSRLRKAGAEVHVIMTRAAQDFVTELTFREISGQAVVTSMWDKVPTHNVEHIALANLADLLLVAPATANFLAKAAAGLADDMLTTTLLATKAPVFLAPAMNTNMYENPMTQKNLRELAARGFHIIEPASGHLACGVTGKGRLPEPVDIARQVVLREGARPARPQGPCDGRRHARAARPRALPRQPLDGAHGLRNRAGGGGARR